MEKTKIKALIKLGGSVNPYGCGRRKAMTRMGRQRSAVFESLVDSPRTNHSEYMSTGRASSYAMLPFVIICMISGSNCHELNSARKACLSQMYAESSENSSGNADGFVSYNALNRRIFKNPHANWVEIPAIAAARYCRPVMNRIRNSER